MSHRFENSSKKTVSTTSSGSGKNKVTKRITEETRIVNGKKIITRSEEVIEGPGSSSSDVMSTTCEPGSMHSIVSFVDTAQYDLQSQRMADFDGLEGKFSNDRFFKKFDSRDTLPESFSSSCQLEKKGKSEVSKTNNNNNNKIDKQSMKEFRSDALKAHNNHRAKHGVPPLKLSDGLNAYAQNWAEHLIKAGRLEHSKGKLKNGERPGENCAMKWSSAGADYTGQEVTDYWYSEVDKYHSYGSEPHSNSAGHFTQVVWKSSKELGVGKASDGRGRVVVVGSYWPAGNFVGEYGKNVLRRK